MENELTDEVLISLLLGAGFFYGRFMYLPLLSGIYERTVGFALPHGISLRWYLLQ